MRRILVIAIVSAGYAAFSAPLLNESPAVENEWGYRPDGQTLNLNPPGFVWRPCKDAAGYRLQVARDKQFRRIAYEAQDVPWSAHCPAKPFDPGRYHWRYAARGKDGALSDWSKVRAFDIAEDAAACPQPTRGELAERMPKEHPRLFFRPEDVSRFSELSKGSLAENWKKLLDAADQILASPPDLSEPPKYPPEVSRKETPDQWRKIWWGNHDRSMAAGNAAATLAFAYRIGGDEQCGKAARDLLMGMAAWDPQGATEYEYNDEAAMPILYLASRAYTWAYPLLSDADRAAVVETMRIRGAQAFGRLQRGQHLWKPYNSHSNRAWHFLGELAIAFYDTIPEAPEWLDYAMTIFYTVYPAWGDDDGGWHEGAAYWNSYTSRFMYWAYVVRAAFGIDVFERPFYKRIGDYALYIAPPGSKTGGFADLSLSTTSNSLAPLVAVLAQGARNPHWKWYADACGYAFGGGYLDFIYAANAPGLTGQPPSGMPASACFRGTGIATLNTNLLDADDNIALHFKSSPFGRQSHGYNSNNAFLLHMGGERVFISSGTRDLYGSKHHAQWMWESLADNAILVDGKGQIKHSPEARGRIVAFDTSPNVDIVVGEAGRSYENLDRWTRRIVFLKPHAILIHDLLDTPHPATFQWRLHAIAPFAIEDRTVRCEAKTGTVDVRFLQPATLELSQSDRFDIPPGDWVKMNWKEWHLTADAAERARHREFLVLMTLNDAPVAVSAKPGRPNTLDLSTPGGEVHVDFRPDRFTVNAPGFRKTIKDIKE